VLVLRAPATWKMSWHSASWEANPVVFLVAVVKESTLVTTKVAGIMVAPDATVLMAEFTLPLYPTTEGQKFPQSSSSQPPQLSQTWLSSTSSQLKISLFSMTSLANSLVYPDGLAPDPEVTTKPAGKGMVTSALAYSADPNRSMRVVVSVLFIVCK